ncbi:patatin-like phospholipase family protein [Croceibacterium ferulae]|uniref:patatin-like phospholipase family protein n=1 Tax=Croceibacterium ferulae TaxID=1854641 RepID=UPI000EAF4147|nr:patatin-like phospholipase family protein [Croceibacterium ferulae]
MNDAEAGSGTLAETMGDHDVVLVLAGGNALGAYQAGVYQALHEGGIRLDRIVGASIGAFNGAIIAGNAPDQRLARLAEFWRPGPVGGAGDWMGSLPDTWRRSWDTFGTLLAGRPGMFAPLGSNSFSPAPPAIYDTRPLAAQLARLIDLDRLNSDAVHYVATAVDLETAEEVTFDNRTCRIGIDHIRASGALPPSFPPIEIDGRLFVDGGLAENLPLDPVLSNPPERPTLCIAVDLLPGKGQRPDTLSMMTERVQDLVFAIQSRRTIARWQDLYATGAPDRQQPVTLACLTYADQQAEVVGKAMDFSPASVRFRWDAGHRDGSELVRLLREGTIAVGGYGLQVHHLPGQHKARAELPA